MPGSLNQMDLSSLCVYRFYTYGYLLLTLFCYNAYVSVLLPPTDYRTLTDSITDSSIKQWAEQASDAYSVITAFN